MFSIFNIGTAIRKMKIRNKQLNLYYPKEVYESAARHEMKIVLTQYNDLFYEAYPEKLKGQKQLLLDHQPRTHSKKYEVQRDLKIYQTKKVRRKELAKIEEYLNLTYIAEEQITHYTQILNKATKVKKQLAQGMFSEFFPQLFEERSAYLEVIQHHCLQRLEKLTKDRKVFERAIDDLVHNPQSFWADASRLLGDIVSDSVKHVVDVVDHTFRKK